RSARSSSAVRAAPVDGVEAVCVMGHSVVSTDKMCNRVPTRWTTCTPGRPQMDGLDVRVLDLFASRPRIGVLEAARRLGAARGTVQARLDRLAASGVILGWGPRLSPEALGYPVTAFLTLEIRQGAGHEAVAAHLAGVPEVLEAHTITGAGDMW